MTLNYGRMHEQKLTWTELEGERNRAAAWLQEILDQRFRWWWSRRPWGRRRVALKSRQSVEIVRYLVALGSLQQQRRYV